MGLSTESGSLREIQQAIQAYVLSGDRGAEGRVLSTARVDARTRLDIYADGYRLRLLEALEDDFRSLQASIGEEAFRRLAEAYIDEYPSRHFSLRYFGQRLPRFLSRGAHAANPWLSDLASFEWLLGEAFDASDALPVGIEALGSVPPERWPEMAFSLHPSVRRIELGWNVPAIRKAFDAEEPLPAPEPFEAPVPWLVWRQGLKTYYRSLEPDEAAGFDRIAARGSFGMLCEDLCHWTAEDEIAARAAGFLRVWVTDGLLTAIHLG